MFRSFLSFLFLAVWFPSAALADSDYLYLPVNYRVYGEDMVDLRRTLGIGGQYNGRQVEFVVLRARTSGYQGVASLFTNGHQNGYAQGLDGFSRDLYFRPSTFADEIGFEVQQLKLYLRGDLLVEGLGVKFVAPSFPPPPAPIPAPPPAPTPGPQPIVESAIINLNVVGSGELEINRYISFARYQGYQLRSATVRGRPDFSSVPATVAFCGLKSCTNYEPLDRINGSVVLYPQVEFVNRNVSWFFEIEGNLFVESIALEFVR